MPAQIEVRRKDGKIWSHLRQKWLVETPEEGVRQEFLCTLVQEYGYSPSQMAEELEVTGRGSGHARADFVIWRSDSDRKSSSNPLIIVECKSDNVTISADDYSQGDNYARLTGAKFFVTHNSRETRFWRVLHKKMPKSLEEISNLPHADATDKEIDDILNSLKVFKEDEFAKLLHDCHNVIRNREKLDPAAAFDEIAKILFVKVFVERELKAKRARKNLFNLEYLEDQIGRDPLNALFSQTKVAYSDDKIFSPDEEIRLRPATGREIVKLLERYNLSDTSEDIKGIAFERFLGRTFRGEIGQFFTPRTIVEFMIRMVGPREGDVICDPASGSGGFLIRFFELVREQIHADADAEYAAYKRTIEGLSLSEEERADALRLRYRELQEALDPRRPGSRLWSLANRCIYGTDANDRMARTSKMNMIMHGDGHAGVHHHDGFLNVNGIFEGRFDIILTNPPFGSSVSASDVVHDQDVETSPADERRYREEYGALYDDALKRVRAAVNKPITSLFDLPKSQSTNIKTEILFVERCLNLLKPGGKLGIVLPEGIFNNPSLSYVREFCENRAYIRAVVSLPAETFLASGASVKASLLFLQKYTTEEAAEFERLSARVSAEVRARREREDKERPRLLKALADAASGADRALKKSLERELAAHRRSLDEAIVRESRAALKQQFDYPIFMYEAERVGLTPTGEEDLNELCRYPRDQLPPGVTESCLELYERFRADPASFAL